MQRSPFNNVVGKMIQHQKNNVYKFVKPNCTYRVRYGTAAPPPRGLLLGLLHDGTPLANVDSSFSRH